jgi:hypothetical protein
MLTQMFCCSMALCNAEQLKASTYVHLYSDRIEYNYAMSICFSIIDCPSTIYLDRDIAELSTMPDCCRPATTICSCAPTCWDAQGQVRARYTQFSRVFAILAHFTFPHFLLADRHAPR